MIRKKKSMTSRRAFLRSAAGVTIALPMSEFCMLDNRVASAAGTTDPINLVTVYFPNGCDPLFWNYNSALSPLVPMKAKLAILHGIKNTVSIEAQDDAHWHGGVSLFTGHRAVGGNKSGGISIDQFASKTLDINTALRQPLVAGVWRGFAGGSYRSIDWFRRSWLEDGSPVLPIQNPLDIYKSIFGLNRGSADIAKGVFKKSTLDFVVDEYKSMTGGASILESKSKSALADHLDRIRDIEKRALRFQADYVEQCKVNAALPSDLRPAGVYSYSMFEQAYRQQMDLVVMALQCGITHTASLMFGSAGEEYLNQSISNIPDHTSSHYSDNGGRDAFLSYRRFHMSNILYFLQKLDSIVQTDGKTLLDNSAVMIGSEFGESRTHTRSPQPMMIAGGACKLKMNQELDVAMSHTTNDVLVTVLRGVGINVNSFGQSGSTHNVGVITDLLL